jgi:hypothetical protein
LKHPGDDAVAVAVCLGQAACRAAVVRVVPVDSFAGGDFFQRAEVQ